MTVRALKVGDYIKTRYKGGWQYAILHETIRGLPSCELIDEAWIPKGAEVVQCVWTKGEQLAPRKVIVKQDGPATYVRPKPMSMAEMFGSAPTQGHWETEMVKVMRAVQTCEHIFGGK